MTRVSPPPRATARVNTVCSGACIFCSQQRTDGPNVGGSTDSTDSIAAHRAGHDAITLVGGEPGEAADLALHVAAARDAGFSSIGVQTNARALAAPGRLAALAAAGLTDVQVSIHGSSAAVHDYHTGVPGSFVAVEALLGQCHGLGLPAVVITVLTRSNYAVLHTMPVFLAAHRVAGWCLDVPHVAGRLANTFDRVYPRLAMAIPHALRSVAAARSSGVSAWVRGAPLCLLGPLSQMSLPSEARSFGSPCEGCEARAECPGLDPAYLERFRGDELRARARAQMAAHTDISRCFVGVGEFVPLPRARTPAPSRSLPVLT